MYGQRYPFEALPDLSSVHLDEGDDQPRLLTEDEMDVLQCMYLWIQSGINLYVRDDWVCNVPPCTSPSYGEVAWIIQSYMAIISHELGSKDRDTHRELYRQLSPPVPTNIALPPLPLPTIGTFTIMHNPEDCSFGVFFLLNEGGRIWKDFLLVFESALKQIKLNVRAWNKLFLKHRQEGRDQAFGMGLHSRLGSRSIVQLLLPDITGKILKLTDDTWTYPAMYGKPYPFEDLPDYSSVRLEEGGEQPRRLTENEMKVLQCMYLWIQSGMKSYIKYWKNIERFRVPACKIPSYGEVVWIIQIYRTFIYNEHDRFSMAIHRNLYMQLSPPVPLDITPPGQLDHPIRLSALVGCSFDVLFTPFQQVVWKDFAHVLRSALKQIQLNVKAEESLLVF